MNKEIFGIRIKAWLGALEILILAFGLFFGIIFAPKIVKIIFNVIICTISISLILYGIAIELDIIMN